MRSLIAAVVLVAFTTTTEAATITLVRSESPYGYPEFGFTLRGEIAGGDVERFQEVLDDAGVRPGSPMVVSLSSPGGSYQTGLDLALFIRRNGIGTIVEADGQCYSACAIAFLGGSESLRDPNPADPDAIPILAPSRSIELGAEVGFHAPYLAIGLDGEYPGGMVQAAYSVAVDAIARFIDVADQLGIPPAELPRLLAPGPDDFFMVDTVDAIRTLNVFVSRRPPAPSTTPDTPSVTRLMVLNTCVNNWHHRRGRSAYPGYVLASDVMNEFEEGSLLLENGEAGKSFSVRGISNGAWGNPTWLATVPIDRTSDGKNFVWCLYSPSHYETKFRPAGSLAELLEPLQPDTTAYDFLSREGTITLESRPTSWLYEPQYDFVPADTKITDIDSTLMSLKALEEPIR